MEEQLAQLKKQPPASGTTGEAARRPAFIVGGWDANQEAKVILEKAKKTFQELQVDVDLDGAFVPGLRRGYIIVPMTARADESGDDVRSRVQQAVLRVRTVNVTLGTRDDGEPSRLWMAVSQPPERRKRAQLAAKTKRLILEMNGDNLQLEVEWFVRVSLVSPEASGFRRGRQSGRGRRCRTGLDQPERDSTAIGQ